MDLSLTSLGSLVLDVDGGRLDALFLDAAGTARDRFTMLKRPPNRPPVAGALPSPRMECTSPQGAQVSLDGTGSFDPDAGDAISLYEWFEDYGTASQALLATGAGSTGAGSGATGGASAAGGEGSGVVVAQLTNERQNSEPRARTKGRLVIGTAA